MNPLQDTLVRLVGLLIGAISAILVLRDANSLRDRGAKLTPWLWAILIFFACGLAVPIYLIVRLSLWNQQIDGPRRQGARTAGEALELSLTCEYGKQIALTEGSAGSTVRCACNRTLQVPSLSRLRKMARLAGPE